MKKSLLSSLMLGLALTGVTTLKAQDVSELIKSGPEDATKLVNAYFQPAFKGFGFGMNSAWFNSAKAKNLGKFDLKFQATGAFVPSKDQEMRFADLKLSDNVGWNRPTSPTFFGKDDYSATLILKDDNGVPTGAQIDMPEGLGFHTVPSPQVQLTVGIIKNTDVSVRYTPKFKGDDFGAIQSWGFGVKHEITKYLLPGKTEKIIPIDLALAFGYNQLTYDYKIKVGDQLNDENPGVDQNQRVEAKLSGYTIDAILSKKLAVFTPFVSIGYNSAKTKLDVLGKYNFKDPNPLSTDYIRFTDPVKIDRTDISGLRGNVGFALHLAFFRLYASYSVGEYQAVSGGIGFGIGK
ncbi:hypothetical protein BCY91_09595 [Pelobium manganitolerans]|uniref:Outer membrane protein beta-barrel domain-containing protein n=1 Tax=Pelobium manganitolerans TaxID=1842495 RepID=A0A419S3E1_9SPHI|nr:DUF6588 family protein [Pelobium manganitolerans]RKD13804.1 hypothetical protein BCY91_09595 [Pelobium manganitolerans]